MGVKVTLQNYTSGPDSYSFPNALDWYISDEGFLDIYEPHNGDSQFVIMQFNKDVWAIVEWDPPLPPDPQQDNEKEDTSE